VKKVRITPEIAERLRRGEEVSPEEIAEASRQAEERARLPPQPIVEINLTQNKDADISQTDKDEWLPESVGAPKKRAKGKRK
jgi:hypothetical protein